MRIRALSRRWSSPTKLRSEPKPNRDSLVKSPSRTKFSLRRSQKAFRSIRTPCRKRLNRRTAHCTRARKLHNFRASGRVPSKRMTSAEADASLRSTLKRKSVQGIGSIKRWWPSTPTEIRTGWDWPDLSPGSWAPFHPGAAASIQTTLTMTKKRLHHLQPMKWMISATIRPLRRLRAKPEASRHPAASIWTTRVRAQVNRGSVSCPRATTIFTATDIRRPEVAIDPLTWVQSTTCPASGYCPFRRWIAMLPSRWSTTTSSTIDPSTTLAPFRAHVLTSRRNLINTHQKKNHF